MIAALALRLGIPKAGIYAALGLIAFLAVAAVILIADGNGYNRADAKWQAKLARAEAAAKRIEIAAAEIAATERAADVIRLDTQAKERTDAIQSAAPSRTGNATRQLGCARLRAAGRDKDAAAAGCADR